MGTLLDLASLVVVPSGYKEDIIYSVKPTDGSGDLDFTRALDTATRVGPDGLIEKVRTNLLLQSNGFDTASWGNDDSTETSGQAGYDGTNNAWLLTKTGVSGRIGQIISVGGSATFSVFVKAGTDNFVKLASSDAGVEAYFDLTNGTIGTTGAGTLAKITSAGNGFFRCSISGSASFTFFNIWVADADNDTSGASGTIFIQNSQLEAGDIATPYIPTTTAAVSVGMLANVPRLDYLGGGCPKLLLEPQRINKWFFSEQIDNAQWLKLNVTITANSAVSPDGFVNADKMVDTTANDEHRIRATDALFTITTATTFSIFAKAAEYSRFAIANLSASEYVKFNLSTGSVISTGANFSNAKIENYGNGWYRLSATTSTNGTHGYGLLNDAGDFVFTGTGTKGVFVWGCMAEEAAYATSYIPTLAAAVTRSTDAASKTGISALIGQTEGVLFVEVDQESLEEGARYQFVSDGSFSNRIVIYQSGGVINVFCSAGATFNLSFNPPSGNLKIAFAYKSALYSLFVNGIERVTSAEAAVPTGLSATGLGVNEGTLTAQPPAVGFNQALLFPTRLTNTQLQELTTL